METIMILAQAISESRKRAIWRLDIHVIDDNYLAYLWLRDIEGSWKIHEDGSIERHI